MKHATKNNPKQCTILQNVCAYVDVQGKNEDRSDVVIKKLSALGAKVSTSLGKKCTHVVFKEGSLTTYNKAKTLGTFIVSANWVEACEKQKKIVPENMYPTMNKDKYEKEELPGVTPKLRKTRSLQPKSDQEFSKQIDAKISKKKMTNPKDIQDSPHESSKVKFSLKVFAKITRITKNMYLLSLVPTYSNPSI